MIKKLNNIWSPLKGYEGIYQINENGKVRVNQELKQTYNGIIQRCSNVNHDNYERYGGRGIKVCNRWRNSYYHFLFDVINKIGLKPNNHTLDRIDNNGDYEVDNIRWATYELQANNREYFGNKVSLTKRLNKTHCGSKNVKSILSEKEIPIIKTYLNFGGSVSEIAKLFKVSVSTIKHIKMGRTWKQITQ